ncbi:helix-turn-helix domain-containing protein [Streptosporangium sp. CA-135522]|uniref:helix-turn-helix domain-containing protein n=1 Tax=Streptosporangium sp. CA-135522 TaxID=3240072 RepID=UPI003D930DDB
MEACDLSLSELLKYLREAAGMTQAQEAERLCGMTGTWTLTRHEVSRWERGRVRPDAWLPAIADLFDIDLEILQRAPRKQPPSAPYADSGTGLKQENELLRRTFLKRGMAVSALPTLHSDQQSRVIQALDLVAGDHLGGAVDTLGDLIDHYAVTLYSLSPVGVYDELLSVRSYASSILDRTGAASRRAGLALATGWLSHLLAVAACDMGEHAAARVWCSDAERRSLEAGHPELAAWALLTKAMIAFYQGQPRQSVRLAEQGQEVAPMGTVIHAKLASQEMRAAAMVGDADHMARARHHSAKAIAALPSDAPVTGVFSIALAEDPPYTATSLLLVGRFREAVSATNRVIQTVYQPEARQRGEHPSSYARSLLILGLAQAGLGRLDEAVAAGHTALAGSRPAWPTMVLAGKLDKTLGSDFGHARQTADYHARYLEVTNGPAGHRPQLPAPAEDRG